MLHQIKSALQVQIPSTEFLRPINQKQLRLFHGEFDYSRDEIDAAFRQLSGESASVKDDSRQLQLNLEWNNDYYNTVVFWTVKDKDFYCLEPWTAPRNALNTGDGLISLPPGDSFADLGKYERDFFVKACVYKLVMLPL